MCFGFFGIQIGFGLQNANTSRIFQSLGVEVNHLAILWIAAPATGLLVQPIIGYLSDKTWGRLGRRRPYFFWGAILTSAALLVMPNAPVAVDRRGRPVGDGRLDQHHHGAVPGLRRRQPARRAARLGLRHAELLHRRGRGPGLGPAVDADHWFSVSNVAEGGGVPPRCTSPSTPARRACCCRCCGRCSPPANTAPSNWRPSSDRAGAKGEAPDGGETPDPRGPRLSGRRLVWTLAGARPGRRDLRHAAGEGVYVLAGMIGLFGVAQVVAGLLRRAGRTANGFSEVVEDLFRMPATMKQLAVVQFFSWFGLFAMWIYTTPAVTAFHYHAADAASRAYNDGADWVGVLFAIYNGVAALAALVIPLIARAVGRKASHALCLVPGRPGPGWRSR
jgi:maltose/moltooligosaccharide transporter